MPLPPRLAACLLLPLLAACATPPGPPDARLTALVARLPAQLAEFELQDSAPAANNAASWNLRYAHAASGASAGIILNIPAGDPVPEGPDSPVVRGLVNALSLVVQARAGGGGLTRLPDFAAAATGQPPEIRCSDLQLKLAEGAVRRVLICATGVGGAIASVNIMAQHPPEAADAARLFMTNFALQAIRALRGPGAPGAAPALPPAAAGRVFRL